MKFAIFTSYYVRDYSEGEPMSGEAVQNDLYPYLKKEFDDVNQLYKFFINHYYSLLPVVKEVLFKNQPPQITIREFYIASKRDDDEEYTPELLLFPWVYNEDSRVENKAKVGTSKTKIAYRSEAETIKEFLLDKYYTKVTINAPKMVIGNNNKSTSQ